MRNGWNFPLAGLTAKWELFARTGTKADVTVVHQSGEIAANQMGAGQTCSLETPFVEFKGTESREGGLQGHKYFGYRVRFCYQGVEVKVVAFPTSLENWQPTQ
ncbi:MAG: hypothetical protein JW889_09950 [Verrucomicrobia bacterium]|nr:hypothetical protein [Verrucomicrobiota bacterium]